MNNAVEYIYINNRFNDLYTKHNAIIKLLDNIHPKLKYAVNFHMNYWIKIIFKQWKYCRKISINKYYIENKQLMDINKIKEIRNDKASKLKSYKNNSISENSSISNENYAKTPFKSYIKSFDEYSSTSKDNNEIKIHKLPNYDIPPNIIPFLNETQEDLSCYIDINNPKVINKLFPHPIYNYDSYYYDYCVKLSDYYKSKPNISLLPVLKKINCNYEKINLSDYYMILRESHLLLDSFTLLDIELLYNEICRCFKREYMNYGMFLYSLHFISAERDNNIQEIYNLINGILILKEYNLNSTINELKILYNNPAIFTIYSNYSENVNTKFRKHGIKNTVFCKLCIQMKICQKITPSQLYSLYRRFSGNNKNGINYPELIETYLGISQLLYTEYFNYNLV